jgi:ABC-type multidrug transport system fused ATPase/permease subunit
MTSVERSLEYASLPNENHSVTNQNNNEKKLPNNDKGSSKIDLKNWPSKGEIRFENVSFRYDSNLPNVLNDLTFKINAGEKIGIVGRTGSGKSSIIQTLFRMAEPEGKILIDDLNIKDISLHDLRSRIAIIPVNLSI